ncbi:MAG: DNA helicase RecG [Candidatus Nealsonbacteria bacterium CG_4_10_14_0_2_um_filter_40_15]|uniref:ATP-dependent DNA helicase RecG n=1 Tax=Candidatus Nealsonbacteria bacterium CG_4_10_14_0_2_um_filter_40_15 TaxID=1974682 RepID=A0A2M7UUL1_9BACT|nr:MAG: DNA helicase RecG [Candidatus Nealsonbacteria bacterium CG_4_10_14_0_2_um_filter_40_15]
MNLSSPIWEIPRVGPQTQKQLKRLGIETIGELIFHFPHRYEDFSNLIPISQAEEGGPFCFQGRITDIRTFRAFRRKMMLTQATIEDETGKIKALWFNQPYLINTLRKGTFVCLAGKVKGKKSSKYLSNPAYEKIPENYKEIDFDLNHTGGLIPIYPETEGLSSKWLRFIVKPLLTQLKNKIPDYLPEKISKKYDFLPFQKAIWQIHFPDSLELAEKAKKRFAFEELFELSLFVLRERMKLAKEKALAIPINVGLMQEFTASLPYRLTNAQKRSSWQILKDLEKPRPMNRLLEGDVGSGKTVVAAMAALNVVKKGYQVAFMAPTEILAKQHFKTINEVLKKFDLKVGLITGKESYCKNEKITRRELIEKVKKNKINILIGTHALIQDITPATKEKTPLQFNNLALVIIDEQHRFGVKQRAKLCRQKEFIPHLLSMTATPIPRTLSLTIYGDLDLSVIDELPKGRKKIITKIIQPKEKKATYNFIREQIKKERQAFVICPRIEPPKVSAENLFDERTLSWMDVKAVKQEYKKLAEEIFPDLKIGMLHGKMKSQEKENIMTEFKEKIIDILVSTSVVEVGVDVPNASVMMIEGSEKFGLAQLHQFRGRVGRSDFQSYCFLFVDTPGIVYNRRLRALITCDNGFELAEKDLAIRGPGDFTGQRQWGIPDLAMASLTDTILVSKARNEAKEILQKDPELKKFPFLRERLAGFRQKLHLE